jgi:hemoglobin/transferrin/lactoferrin receptor protein
LRPIYDIPGDTVSLTLGGRIGKRFETGATFQQVYSRRVILSQTGPVTRPVYIIGKQDGYRLYGLFARYAVTDRLEGRLRVENLTNARYDLNDGFGGMIGPPAPGRNTRLSIALAF